MDKRDEDKGLTKKDYDDILIAIERFILKMEEKSLGVTRDLDDVTIGELRDKANKIFSDIQTLRSYLYTQKNITVGEIEKFQRY